MIKPIKIIYKKRKSMGYDDMDRVTHHEFHECKDYSLFLHCLKDLIDEPSVRAMDNYIQHSSVTTFQHGVFVSYLSFSICKTLRWNYYSAARGGLLHDMYLYDWHDSERLGKWHAFTHPYAALRNATALFTITKMEQDIIKKHMWPLTLKLPRYRESIVVSIADKLATCLEVVGLHRLASVKKIMSAKI